jgi:hypothetical protein
MHADAIIPDDQIIQNNKKKCDFLLYENLLQNCFVNTSWYILSCIHACFLYLYLCENYLLCNWLVNPGAFSQGACMPIIFMSTKQCETATRTSLFALCENVLCNVLCTCLVNPWYTISCAHTC